MRYVSVAVLVVVLVCASVVVNVMDWLHHVEGSDASLAGLIRGELGPVFLTARVWQRLPVASPSFLVDWRAFLVSAAFVALSVWVVRVHFKRSWLATGVCVLVAVGPVYVGARFALWENTDPSRAGPWLALVLLTLLYGLLACAVFAVVEIIRPTTARSCVSSDSIRRNAA